MRSSQQANDLWCADFKGQFRLKNQQYCYPLTVTDHRSRYILACNSHESTKEGGVSASFEDVFEQYGLPAAIRTDNGIPFSCPNALLGLSKLSVWWLRLGIQIERIRPGNPVLAINANILNLLHFEKLKKSDYILKIMYVGLSVAN